MPVRIAPTDALAAARTLHVDATTVEVTAALADSGIASLLVRGPTIAHRLYPDGGRRYLDCDLLVEPGQMRHAGEVLAALGFAKFLDDLDVPPHERPLHAHTWTRSRISVDLHRTLLGIGASPERVWTTLAPEADALILVDTPVSALSPAATALVVSLHVAQHGSDGSGPREDLERALARFSLETWQVAADLARRLDAVSAFAGGLRLLPAGAELARALELPSPPPDRLLSYSRTAPPGVVTLELIAAAPSLTTKLAIARRRVVPTTAYMRAYYPVARRGRRGLARAYVARAVRLPPKLLPALRAWARTRRGSR